MKTKLLSVCLFVFLFSIIFLLLGCPPVDKPPKLTIPDKTVDEGQVLQFDLKQYAEDKDKNTLVFTIVSGVGEIVGSDYRYAPTFDNSGEKEVKIRVTNAKGKSAEDTFKITVNDVNRPPSLDIPDQTMNEGEILTLDLLDYTTDPDTLDTFTYTLLSGVGNIAGSTYTYTATYTDAGTKTVTVRVTDNKGGTGDSTFKITVNDVNRPPVLDIPDQTIDEGETLTLDLNDYADDPDGDDLTFTLVSGVGEINDATYTYTPDYDVLKKVREYNPAAESVDFEVSISASDGKGGEATATFTIRVTDVNRPPVLDIPDQTIDEGESLTLNLNDYADDPDGNDLTFSLVSGVGEINDATYTYTPDYDVLNKGREYSPAAASVDFEVSISANDGKGGEANATFTIRVTDVNRPPVLDIPDQTIDEGEILTLNLLDYTTDPDALDTFTYTLISGVGNIAGSTYTYAATYTDSGTKTVTVRVTDNKGGTGDSTFKITVNALNRPPVLDIPDQTIDEGETLTLYLNDYADDPDGDDLTFTLVSGVGEITDATYTYTPDYDVLKKVREYNQAAESVDFEVSISANDGKGGEATTTFTIRVTDVNRPPALNIPDQTINEGETLTLNLLDYTTDPDTLDTFTYTLISGVGNIAGSTYTYTATYTDAGTKTVTVRVTDNKGGTGQSVFGITVNRLPVINKLSGPSGTINQSSVTFSWTGNDPDGEIEKYEYRKDEGNWIDHGLNTSYTWSGYAEGPHKFEVRAPDNNGAYSNVITWGFVYVRPNIPPVIEKAGGLEGMIGKDSNTFTWTGNDTDGTIAKYKYRKKDEGNWIDHGLNTSYTWSGYTEGPHKFEVRAQDNDGAYSNIITWDFIYNAAEEIGGVKVANSWGIGGWENVPDGFLYITYGAMKQNKVLCFVVDPKDNYEPRAIAVFKISHPVRDDCYVYVGVGNPSSPSREKRFDDFFYRGGPWPFPNNKMVLDITELLPFNNETLYLKVYDTKTGSTGTIEFFSVEIYDNYPSGVPSSVFISTQTPKNTVNDSYVNVQIPGVTVSAVSNYDLSSNTGGLSKRLLEGMKETMGVYEEGRDYNEIINGYGTGLRPPSAEEWKEIANSWYEMKPFGLQETLPVSLDHSSSVHFPPIGNQGSEGSCVAFSVGYYTATFYEARDRNCDLSGAQWVGGYYGAPTASYQDRILSPDFIYHQINDGYDQGSAYQDAMKLISNIGVSSWKEMPYNPSDSKTWPSESAWREAPRYRSHTNVMRVLRVENDQDIQTLKSYINAGYLVSISVDASKYNYLTANDVWNSNNYTYPNTNHANTIVGYDDLLCGDLPTRVVKIKGPSGNTSQTTSTFSWTGNAPDGEIVKYEYRKDGGSWVNHGLNTSYTWSGYSEGPHKFEVRAQDNKGVYSKPVEWNFTYSTVVVGEMVLVEKGTFMMGDEFGDLEDWCRPVHQVTLTYDFYMGKYEVTFDEYDAFCEATGRGKPSDQGWGRGNRPVIWVSWWDAIAYCNWLSEKEGLPVAYRLRGEPSEGQMLDANGNETTDITKVIGYRLPTEAEWEYAARGGKHHSPYKYSGSDNVDEVAWYWDNSYNNALGRRSTWPVGLKLPNALGIYDMSGNVWEWCSDWFGNYSSSAQKNPYNSTAGSARVVRGGSWYDYASGVRVAVRGSPSPTSTYSNVGFRIARTVP